MAPRQRHSSTSSPSRESSTTTPRPPTWRVLVLAARPNTLAASLTPVVVGLSVCVRVHGFGRCDVGAGLLFWVFACLVQIGTNLHNDYADFVKGADTAARVGPARATQRGWLAPGETAALAGGALFGAALVGAALTRRATGGAWMLWVTATSLFNAVA